jgi:NADH-quinone oxidoreductase subunit M
LLGAFIVNTWVAVLATTGIILSAGYALWLYRRIIFGILDKPALKHIKDLSWREVAVMTPLIIITIIFGFHPNPILDVSTVSVETLMTNFKASLAAAEHARFALAP